MHISIKLDIDSSAFHSRFNLLSQRIQDTEVAFTHIEYFNLSVQ